MNKELFHSMQGQLRPGTEVRAELREKLAKKKTAPVGRYAAIAACGAVIVGAVLVFGPAAKFWPGWHTSSDRLVDIPHSYVTVDSVQTCRPADSAAENNVDSGGGEDMDMTPGEVAVNTGEALADSTPDQSEAVMAYQNLMAQFERVYGPDRYPEWYGGAYIDIHAGLIVNIVQYDDDQMDKDALLQIEEWAGGSRIGFGSGKLSLNQLRELQAKTFDALCGLGLDAGCGVNEETGQVEVTLPEFSEEALWKLAELDPADTAILVYVASAVDGAAPGVSHSVQPGGAGDADNAIAWEPQN